MGAFEYSALDGRGQVRKGMLEGDTERQIRQQLRDQGLVPLAVATAAERERRHSRTRGGRLAAADLALMTRQLATLVRSGLPLEEALRVMGEQNDKARLKRLLLSIRARVLEGHSLAVALADFPLAFPDLYRATVGAGEQSGHLEQVLERLADYTEARQQLRQRVQLALIYPLLLTSMAVLVTGALLTYVVPQVVQVFDNIGQELPWLTQALIGLSGFLRRHGWLLLLGAIGAALVLRVMLHRPAPQRRLHRLLLRSPVLGRVIQGLNCARFARTLSILSASSVPVLEGMRIAGSVLTNAPMRQAVEEAAERVREGASIHAALGRHGVFPPMTIHLIASGEASGRLEGMLERAAIHQEREVETRLAAALGLFEPLLILAMGGLVLVVVLAILLPIFDLNQLVR